MGLEIFIDIFAVGLPINLQDLDGLLKINWLQVAE